MSRVLALSIGIRASTSPAITSMPGLDRHDRVHRQQVARLAAACQLADLALLVLDHHAGRRSAPRGECTPIDDHAVGDAGDSSRPLADRHAFDQVLEVDDAFDLGEHRTGIGVPLGETIAALDLDPVIARADACRRAAGARTLGAVLDRPRPRSRVAAHDHEAGLARP